MWRKIRGAGLSYGYALRPNIEDGHLYLYFIKSTHPHKAYEAGKKIIVSDIAEWNYWLNAIPTKS